MTFSAMPKTLFWRLTSLLLIALAVAVLAMVLLFRQDRASLIAKHFTDAKLEQIDSLRSTLAKMPLEERADRTDRLQRGRGAL